MEGILVTVILNTYDRPRHLYRALLSVMNQTYDRLEILVIDGGELPETKKVIKKLATRDNRIMWVNAKNEEKTTIYGDVQYARNLGLIHACGKYVAMLDDDDYWMPDKISHQVFYAEIHEAALVSCYAEMEGSNHVDMPSLLPKYKDLLKSFNMSCTSSYLINKEILTKIGAFDESLRSMHEYDIALKLASRGYVIFTVPEVLMTMNRDNSKTRGFYFIKIAEVFDLYRLYGCEMLRALGARGLLFNVIKSTLLISLFLMGFLVKEKVWKIIFKLKNMYQVKSQ